MTIADKDKELLNPTNQELARIERENRKAAKERARMIRTVVVLRDAAGKFRDAEGNEYNAQGQRLDADGNVVPIQEEIPAAQNGGNVGDGRGAGGGDRRVLTLAGQNRPYTFYANRSALVPPPVERNDFELKLQYYTTVGQHQFHGLSSEHPMDHLERFERLLSAIKTNGVDMDFYKMHLFPYSLAGEAFNWLNTQPAGTFTTWEDTRHAFLENFFDDAKSEELRTKISSFEQGPKESFKNAWTRFLKLQRDCPHHGFTATQLLTTFFKGVDWRHQQSLDSASNGNFMTRSTETAVELIKNMAQSNSTKRCDEQRIRETAGSPRDVAEIKASLQNLESLFMNKKKSVSFVDECAEEEVGEENVNFVAGAGFQGQKFNNYTGNNFRGYGSNNGTGFGAGYGGNGFNSNNQQRIWGNEEYKKAPRVDDAIQGIFEQLLEGQSKMTGDFNRKFDNLHTEMNSKFEVVHNHLKKLDIQVAQNAECMRRPNGALPVEQPKTRSNKSM